MNEKIVASYTPVRAFADAKSIAIVGASAREDSWGFSMTKRLVEAGYQGSISLVNRRGGEILGRPVYPTIDAIPGDVDLALATLGNEQILDVATACAGKGTRGLIVYTAGFAEVGERGAELQQDLLGLARRCGMRIIGPNCNGLFNARLGLNLTGNIAPPAGPISFVSQSGNLGLWWFGEAVQRQVGLSHYFSLGNMADVNIHEYIDYLEHEDNAKVVVLCSEALPEPRRLIETARRVARKKPVLALKLGQTSEGAKAALTHTASVAGSYEIAKGMFRQANILRARGLDELIELAEGLATLPRRPLRRVALVGGGGGHATTACDEISRAGLELAALSEGTRERLGKLLPWWANVNNPVEFAGGADQNPLVFSEAVEICLSDPDVDAVLVFGLFGGYRVDQLPHFAQLYEQAAFSIIESLNKHRKPVVLHSIYANRPLNALLSLRMGGIAVTGSLSTGARILRSLARYCDGDSERQTVLPERAAHGSRSQPRRLGEREARELLESFNIACLPAELAGTAAEAVRIGERIGGPVALRIASPDVMHKRVVGGVAVGIQSASEIERKFREIMASVARHRPDAVLDGVWISPVLPVVAEFAVGALRDRAFGDVVMCGLGGPLIEQLHQRSFRLAPFSITDALQMISDANLPHIAAAALGPSSGKFLEALAHVAVNVGTMMTKTPWIAEVDLNPLLVDGERAVVVDPRVLTVSS